MWDLCGILLGTVKGPWGHLPHLVQEVALHWPLLLTQLQGCLVESHQGILSVGFLGERHHCLAGSQVP